MLIYKITNNIDGKIYIGLYSKSKENFQKYWGSGVLISRVIKKYGKANLKKSQTGSNKWTEEQKAKASLKMLGENNPAYGTRYQWMYFEETNKRVPLEQIQNYLDQGWLKGRWR